MVVTLAKKHRKKTKVHFTLGIFSIFTLGIFGNDVVQSSAIFGTISPRLRTIYGVNTPA